MKVLQYIIPLVFLFSSITAYQNYTYKIEDEDEEINLITKPELCDGKPDLTPKENPYVKQVKMRVSRTAVADKSLLWPYGVIPYVIDDSYSQFHKNLIREAMEHIDAMTCVQFIPRTKEAGYIDIQNKYGCNSEIGYFGKVQTVNLQAAKCFRRVGNVLHELAHVIGFIHEHQRPDRDKYITFNRDNMERGHEYDLAVYDEDVIDTSMPYDYLSVTHIRLDSFSSNGKPTISPRQKVIGDIGMANKLSEGDIKKINHMYCPKSVSFKPGLGANTTKESFVSTGTTNLLVPCNCMESAICIPYRAYNNVTVTETWGY